MSLPYNPLEVKIDVIFSNEWVKATVIKDNVELMSIERDFEEEEKDVAEFEKQTLGVILVLKNFKEVLKDYQITVLTDSDELLYMNKVGHYWSKSYVMCELEKLDVYIYFSDDF